MNPLDTQNLTAQSGLQQSENQLQRLQREYMNPTDTDGRKLKKVAQEFEGIFLEQMLTAMDKTIDRDGSILNGGYGEEVFRGMMYKEIAMNIATGPGQGFGLAQTIYQQMSMAMEAKDQEETQGQEAIKQVNTEG